MSQTKLNYKFLDFKLELFNIGGFNSLQLKYVKTLVLIIICM